MKNSLARVAASLIALASIVLPEAQAFQIDGCWKSKSTISIDQNGKESVCESGTYLNLHQTATEFKINVLDYDCREGVPIIDLDKTYTIRGGKVLLGTDVVGLIDQGGLTLTIEDKELGPDIMKVDSLNFWNLDAPAEKPKAIRFAHDLLIDGKRLRTVKAELVPAKCLE